MTTICEICAEQVKFNKNNKVIKCPYCQFKACRNCCETYLLSQTIEKCMNPTCGKTWTRKFITDEFSKSFIHGSLKNHKKNILFEREKSMLPDTQSVVEEENHIEKLKELIETSYEEQRKETLELRHKLSSLRFHIKDIEYDYQQKIQIKNTNDSMDAIYIQRAQLMNLKEQKGLLERTITSIENKRVEYRNHIKKQMGIDSKKRCKSFIRSCPSENCRGFLSSQWKCGICDCWTCPDCHVIKIPEQHVCNPNDIATAKLLSNDTKPCPNCKTGIFKIDGCDQMFCTQCHTGFSWKTGEIETKIHNPHYFEWIRKTTSNDAEMERNPLDVICGREINHPFIYNIATYLSSKITDKNSTKALNICRSIIHVSEVEIPKYQVDDIIDNQDLRILYLRQKITEENFKTELHRRIKKQDYKREHFQLLAMFKNTATDILYRYFDTLQTDNKNIIQLFVPNHSTHCYSNNCLTTCYNPRRFRDSPLYTNEEKEEMYNKSDAILNEIDSLVDYVNECLKTIAKSFGTVSRIMAYSIYYENLTIHYDYKKRK